MKYIYNPTDEQLSAFLGEVDCGQILVRFGGFYLIAAVSLYEDISDFGCSWGEDWPDLGPSRGRQ